MQIYKSAQISIFLTQKDSVTFCLQRQKVTKERRRRRKKWNRRII